MAEVEGKGFLVVCIEVFDNACFRGVVFGGCVCHVGRGDLEMGGGSWSGGATIITVSSSSCASLAEIMNYQFRYQFDEVVCNLQLFI